MAEFQLEINTETAILFYTEQLYRSSHRRCSVKVKLQLQACKVAGLRPATLLRKRLWRRCFPVNFTIFLRTAFYRTPLVAASHSSISMLHFFDIEKYWQWTKDRNTTKKRHYTQTVGWFHFYFDIYNRFLSLYSFEWLIKWKGTNVLFR